MKTTQSDPQSWASSVPNMDQAKNTAESVIVGNCLSCRGLVRVPATADAKSLVRCPHCEDSYSLQQVLIDTVPELEFITDDPDSLESEDKKPREKFVVPVQLSKGAKRSKRRARSRAASEGRGRGEPYKRRSPERQVGRRGNSELAATGGFETGIVATKSRGSVRPGRSIPQPGRTTAPTSSVGETTKIIIGGLLAFPIAYLLVFWVFHQDPLNIGPEISRVAPFAVPEKLRGPEAENEDELESRANNKPRSTDNRLDDKEVDELPIPDVDPDKIGPIEFD